MCCRATTNRRSLHEKSHISGEIYLTSERTCEVQIKLPKPILTYVLAQCLNNSQSDFQLNPRCSTCKKFKTQLTATV